MGIDELPREFLGFFIQLGKLSAEDQARMVRLVILFSEASDEVKECADVMIQRLKEKVSDGIDVAQGVDEIIAYLENSPPPSKCHDDRHAGG